MTCSYSEQIDIRERVFKCRQLRITPCMPGQTFAKAADRDIQRGNPHQMIDQKRLVTDRGGQAKAQLQIRKRFVGMMRFELGDGAQVTHQS